MSTERFLAYLTRDSRGGDCMVELFPELDGDRAADTLDPDPITFFVIDDEPDDVIGPILSRIGEHMGWPDYNQDNAATSWWSHHDRCDHPDVWTVEVSS